MVHAANDFRDYGNFGRLRSTLLMGTTLALSFPNDGLKWKLDGNGKQLQVVTA